MNQTFVIPGEILRIVGAGGGGKDGGSNKTSGGEEAPNTLKSKQVARVIDLLSEGPIYGVVNQAGSASEPLKGVYFDSVPVQRADGTLNFTNPNVQFRQGTQSQTQISGFPSQESEQPVGLEVKFNFPLVRHIANTDNDRARVTVSVPALSSANKDTGDIKGTSVSLRVEVSTNGGAYAQVSDITIEGKTNSQYQRDMIFTLPRPGPWDIRVSRLTADSTSTYLQNGTNWDSLTEIIDDKLSYANSAVVGIIIDAEQFRSVPKRVYDTKGLLIRVPTNYNADTGAYSGVWDGTFKTAWSDNPAWCLFDMIVNNRYGIGQFIGTASNGGIANVKVDKWSFYKAGVWCDQRVPGKGGTPERRYTCNVQIRDQSEAFDLLQQFSSIFRGFSYWAGGQLVLVADQPSDPYDLFTNANVIDGQFTYSGGDYRQRHTQVMIGWNDPANRGEGRFAAAEDQDAISRYGLQIAQEQAFGCTRESQALRAGKWTLYTEQYEDEAIQFTAGLQGAYLRPGDIIKVMDANIAGRRRAGRIVKVGGDQFRDVWLDAPVAVTAGVDYQFSCVVPSGEEAATTVQSRTIHATTNGSFDHFVISTAFSVPPAPDSIFVMTAPTLDATLWRTLAVKQADSDKYHIEGVRHFPQKWNYVEKGIDFDLPDITDIQAKPPACTNLKVVEYILQTSSISLQVMAVFSWTSKQPLFDVLYHKLGENWHHIRTDQHAFNLQVEGGQTYEFQVTPIGTLGIKGPMASIKKTIIGLGALPATPQNLRINVIESVAVLSWTKATEIDMVVGGHYELRFSTQTSGATWNTAQVAVQGIAGNASSVTTSYAVGTYLLRAFDIGGRASPEWASVIALGADSRYVEFTRICESPDWLGTHLGTAVKDPQDWLIIGDTGGLWDDQLNNMSTWADVDVLPFAPGSTPTSGDARYQFLETLDAGGVFSVRLTADILAFPYYDTDDTVDSRTGNVDDWPNWDDPQGDLGGQIQLEVRETMDDPASPTAVWGPWDRFVIGEHTAHAWQFRAHLTAPPGQNIGIETLCIVADFKNKFDAGEDIPYSATDTQVFYRIKFYNVPAVVVTVQNAAAGDIVEVLQGDPDKTREFFKLRITASGGGHPVGSRTFDWHAQGY